MQTIKRYTDNEFIRQHKSDLDAWYYFHRNSITCVLSHRTEKRIAAWVSVESQDVFLHSLSKLRETLELLDIPELPSEQQHVILVHPYYTFVPDALYVGEKASYLFGVVHELKPVEVVQSMPLDGKVLLYSISELFYRTLRLVFQGSEISHYAGHFHKLTAQVSDNHPHRLYVHLHESYMDVFCFDKQKLQFHNTFSYESETDIIYYLLSVAELLQIPHDKSEVVLSGTFSVHAPLIGLMKKYINQVNIVQRNDNWTYAAAMREMQEQQYYLELTALLCASYQAH